MDQARVVTMKSLEWKRCNLVRKFTLLLATGFGLGLSPFASGTTGTLLGVVIVVALPFHQVIWQIAFVAVLVAIAIPVCTIAEHHFRKKDDGRIVIDEYATFPICLIGLPWITAPWLLAVAFITHRALDIAKPFPADRAQALKGGLGIVIDDVISSIYALALNHAAWWGWQTFLAG